MFEKTLEGKQLVQCLYEVTLNIIFSPTVVIWEDENIVKQITVRFDSRAFLRTIQYKTNVYSIISTISFSYRFYILLKNLYKLKGNEPKFDD